MCRASGGGTGELPHKPTVARVIAAALRRPQSLCAHVWKTLNAILSCRTPALGAHCYRGGYCGSEPNGRKPCSVVSFTPTPPIAWRRSSAASTSAGVRSSPCSSAP